ncbi:hypothetical protein MAPG_09683 [Magnaporthiopsis poae ATCC 64411]|uniref:Uncharacterized protein n=1 Tax=Magnaporthiopsis poae (strain ATCC 64411 / 73-15) TaxID=644358 RepID=A0A0C4EAK8_MAGP6|nr:hypothetical protein MAPG_09683 [Magnaporthiopsis poae ATCC 64411]
MGGGRAPAVSVAKHAMARYDTAECPCPCVYATRFSESGFVGMPKHSTQLTPEPGIRELLAEATLDAYDISIPHPGAPGRGEDAFYFMLLSPGDAGDADTDSRLYRLYSLGVHVGVVFLDQSEGSNGLTEFQIRNMHTRPEMLTIPVSTPEGLPETMAAFTQRLSQPPPRASRLWAVKALLPFCSIRPPLRQHSVNVLSDTCPSFRGLLEIMSCKEGQDSIRSYIGDEEATALIRFFSEEVSL